MRAVPALTGKGSGVGQYGRGYHDNVDLIEEYYVVVCLVTRQTLLEKGAGG